MPRLVDHDQRRAQIVTAVWAIIATRGIQAVSLRTVAAEAGVSVGRIQHYFATKEELVRHGCTVMLERARREFASGIEGLAPADALRVLVHRAVPTTPGFAVGTLVWTTYVLKGHDDDVIARQVRGAQEDGVRIGAAYIESARAAGVFGAGPPAEAIALRLLAMAEGYAARVLAGSLPGPAALAALDAELDALRT